MKKPILLIVFHCFTAGLAVSQNVNGLLFDATNAGSRDQSAAFEINANTNTPGLPLYGGFLPPRVALQSTTDALTIAGTEANGLIVYNTNASMSGGSEGLYYWYSGAWQRLVNGNGSFPTGTGTPNYLARWITGTTLGTGISQDDGSNVGIGVAPSASGKLNVAGPATGSGPTIRAGGGGDVVIASGGSVFFDDNYSYASGNYIRPVGGANTMGFFTSGSERMRILANGNVGIGISAPIGKLDVQGTVTRTGTHATSPSFYVTGSLTAGQAGPAAGNIEFRHDNGSQGIGFGYNTIYQTGSNTNQELNLLSRGNSPITLNAHAYSTGNVGIGNVAPGHQLSVGAATADGQAVTIRGYSNSPASWKGGGAFGYSSATVIMGELGGVAQLGGHNSTLTAWSDLAINSAGGNVGIGSTIPVEKLDIAGNARATGTMYWGNAGTRTETRDDAGTMGGKSGYYETSVPAPAANWYTGASSWQHLLETRHSNTGNNYAMQFAGSFFDQNLWFRKTNNSPTTPWSRILTTNDLSTLSGTPNYLARWTSSTALGIGVTYDNGTNVGISTTGPLAKLDVRGTATITDGNNYANTNNNMQSGSLTLGSISLNYGGGTGGWNANTAGLLFEAADNTEIGVHDSGNRIASLMYYQGGGTNQLTIGRNMGWDNIARTNFAGNNYAYFGPNSTWGEYLQVGGNGRVTTSASVAATNGNLHLDAKDGAFATYINSYSLNNTYINPNAGNVGIGTTSPSEKLTLKGNFNMVAADDIAQSRRMILKFDKGGDADYVRLTLPENYYGSNGGGVKVKVAWMADHAARSNYQEYTFSYSTHHFNTNYLVVSDVSPTVRQKTPLSYGPYEFSSEPNVIFYQDLTGGGVVMEIKGKAGCCSTPVLVETEVFGRTISPPVLTHLGTSAPGGLTVMARTINNNADFTNQEITGLNVSGNQAVAWNAGATEISMGSYPAVNKIDDNSTNGSAILIVGSVTVSGNTLSFGNGVGGYQQVQALAHGVGSFSVGLERRINGGGWTPLIAQSAICAMSIGDYYMQYNGITSSIVGSPAISGDIYRFPNSVTISYFDSDPSTGNYEYRLVFTPGGSNKNGGDYNISQRNLTAVQIKR